MRLNFWAVLTLLPLALAFGLTGSLTAKADNATKVVLLGTGTPLPDPDRAGPSTAIVVNGSAYLFDVGAGTVRRAMAAARRGLPALDSVNLKTAFLTHLHSDHTLGLPDLILTPWVMNRAQPLELYGPKGTREMVDDILAAWKIDIDVRLHDLEHALPNGYKVNVHEIDAGKVFSDANVTVTAFRVDHGRVLTAFGYRIDAPGKTIVISGDTRPTQAVVDACNGCDVLIHEVYTDGSTSKVPEEWQRYRRAYHTSSTELAKIATEAHPKLLVLDHRSNPGCDQAGAHCGNSGSEQELLQEIRRHYTGRVVAAHDLDVF
jgi:ribonuclease BN (tRNA processing enzyme)